MSNKIEALLWEREGYVRRKLADRVKQVEAELKQLGHAITQETATAEPSQERAMRPGAKKRTA